VANGVLELVMMFLYKGYDTNQRENVMAVDFQRYVNASDWLKKMDPDGFQRYVDASNWLKKMDPIGFQRYTDASDWLKKMDHLVESKKVIFNHGTITCLVSTIQL
jgi:uncharacterized protein YehS (DUF1456 family)